VGHTLSFGLNDLVLVVRCELAPVFLVEQGLPITEMTLLLGYSERSAFSRAFRQWVDRACSLIAWTRDSGGALINHKGVAVDSARGPSP
jgi:AraC-like DNA-binding protein